MPRPMLEFVGRVVGGLLFIGSTVALAKAGQYAAVDRLGPTIGFDAASLVGATPVVAAAALLQRRWRQRGRTAASVQASR